MADNTLISWADHTFNGWIGCTKVSPACAFCYAERDWDHRFHRVKWGRAGNRSVTGEDTWRKPLTWDRLARQKGIRYRVFAHSLSDVFDDHPSIQHEWRSRLWRMILATPNLDWLLLTKRPENWEHMVPHFAQGPGGFKNVRLGTSIEDNRRAELRGPKLVRAHDLGWPTFVSHEPALGPVDWNAWMGFGCIDWLITGGESGPSARISHPKLFTHARDCAAKWGVPFHHKQNGEWAPVAEVLSQKGRTYSFRDGTTMRRVGADNAGRLLGGKSYDAFPKWLEAA